MVHWIIPRFQTKRNIRHWNCSMHSLDATNFKSDEKVSCIGNINLCITASLRRPEPICIPKGQRNRRRFCVHGTDLDCWIQRQVGIQYILYECLRRIEQSQSKNDLQQNCGPTKYPKSALRSLPHGFNSVMPEWLSNVNMSTRRACETRSTKIQCKTYAGETYSTKTTHWRCKYANFEKLYSQHIWTYTVFSPWQLLPKFGKPKLRHFRKKFKNWKKQPTFNLIQANNKSM